MATLTHTAVRAVEDANYRHLIADIAWFGLAFTATNRFLAVYALHLGATEADLGWLRAAPALPLIVSASLALYWRARHRNSVDALRLPAFIFRLVFLLPAFTPFLPKPFQIPWLIFAASAPALGQGAAAVMFVASIQESVPQDRMTSLFSRRSLLFNVTLAISALSFGVWLEQVAFPLNYQVMFIAAFIFALMSMWHCLQVQPIAGLSQSPPTVRAPESSPWRSRDFRGLVFIAVSCFVAYTAVIALVDARLVEGMGATESYIAAYSLIELGTGAVAAYFAPRLFARFGYRAVIGGSIALTTLPLLLLSFSSSLGLGLLAACFSGTAWTLVALIGINGLYTQVVPVEHATRFGIVFQQVSGLALFCGPFIGTLLAGSQLELTSILLIGAGLRLAAGVVIAAPAIKGRIGRARAQA